MGNWGCPALGVKGAAIATVIGNGVAFLICLGTLICDKSYLKLHFKRMFIIDKDAFKHIMHIFPSTMLEQAIMCIDQSMRLCFNIWRFHSRKWIKIEV